MFGDRNNVNDSKTIITGVNVADDIDANTDDDNIDDHVNHPHDLQVKDGNNDKQAISAESITNEQLDEPI